MIAVKNSRRRLGFRHPQRKSSALCWYKILLRRWEISPTTVGTHRLVRHAISTELVLVLETTAIVSSAEWVASLLTSEAALLTIKAAILTRITTLLLLKASLLATKALIVLATKAALLATPATLLVLLVLVISPASQAIVVERRRSKEKT